MRKADYNDIARRYDEGRSLSEENMSMWLRLISEKIPEQNVRLLDLGCGTGRFSIPMATELGYSVTAVDASEEMVVRAKAKDGADRVEWLVEDVTRLSFPDSSFDVVFMSHLLHHLDQPFELIERCFQLLIPAGVLINRYGAMEHITGDPEHTFFAGARELDEARTPTVAIVEGWFKAAGLVDIGSETIAQRTDLSASDRVRRAATRVSSVFTLMTDTDFEEGLSKMEAYAMSHRDDPWMLVDKLTLTWGTRSASNSDHSREVRP